PVDSRGVPGRYYAEQHFRHAHVLLRGFLMRTKNKKRRGSVTLLAAFCLTVMVSFVAIAIDGGLMMDSRQKDQSAADASAIAAAEPLFLNCLTDRGLDPLGGATAPAKASAAANGFPNPIVNIPPLSGPFTGVAGHAEVIVQSSQRRYFST